MASHAAHEQQAAVGGWLAKQTDAEITVVDGANRLALYRGDSATEDKKTLL